EAERERAEAVEARATKLKRARSGTYIDVLHFPTRPSLADKLRPGDWAIPCIRDGDHGEVCPPRQFLAVASYPRGKGRRRWLLNFEAPETEECLSFASFGRKATSVLKVPPS